MICCSITLVQPVPIAKERQVKSASELLETYLNNVGTPKVSAAQLAEDGVLELPWVNAVRAHDLRKETDDVIYQV